MAGTVLCKPGCAPFGAISTLQQTCIKPELPT